VRAAVPLLSDGGRITSTGTMFASRAPFPGIGDYAASKAAVAACGRASARDLGSRYIMVNTIQLGPIHTEMNPETSDGVDGQADDRARSLRSTGRDHRCGGFPGRPRRCLHTGAMLNVDGGQNS
jgi:3-oxoacyl-[acyl-carrier protein] reductase